VSDIAKGSAGSSLKSSLEKANKKLKLGVLISGNGSNLQAILDAIAAGKLNAEVSVVIASKSDAYGLERAKKAGIPALELNSKNYDNAAAFDTALLHELQRHKVDWIVMAGYMRLLTSHVLAAYPHRVLNIHPSLLPSFAGAHAIRDALHKGVRVTGVTVHIANEIFDEGPIIAQEAVPVMQDDTLDSLAERIHKVEHKLYPKMLQLIAEDRISVEDNKVIIN
jgi:phosphoribosylglycinamide formyltransferase-1